MTIAPILSGILSPVAHGFFTRKGGASSGVFAGLNCGHGSSDQNDIVQINRARVAAAMGVAVDALKTVRQVHSADAVIVRDADRTPDGPADAMATNVPGVALGILTADCMPILLSDPQAGVVGAAHAGWRGARDGVIGAVLAAMEGLGANRSRVRAAIGPTISQAHYEVGPELLDEFLSEDPQAHRFFAGGRGDRLQFDLPGYGLHRLRAEGVGGAEWIRHCTYRDAGRFFSYRRATHRKEADYGRLISVIRCG
ncbi:peptidoglycan editing factor PgeF [Palleronia rufa]|uniref:peptidoglycan editing factor PgeF n=1 Tax=Palleronia rufa TaxID=1530186 RepID=UPI00055D8D1F|nr:peptidoglycan editing factor PgeF [Palleronia rufa]